VALPSARMWTHTATHAMASQTSSNGAHAASNMSAAAASVAAAAAASAGASATVKSPLPPVDVLIIGAGPAGLGAAWSLEQQFKGRFSYRILEARNRVGGRVLTNHDLGVPVDLGASWLHQYGASNPMAQLAWSARIPIGIPAGGSDLWLTADGATPVEREDFERARGELQRLEGLREMRSHAHQEQCHKQSPFFKHDWAAFCAAMAVDNADKSLDSTALLDPHADGPCAASDEPFSKFVAANAGVPANAASLSANGHAVLQALLNDIEQYEGTSLSSLSTVHGGEQMADLPDGNLTVVSGYGALLQHVAKANDVMKHVQLDTVVTDVEVDLDGVRVTARKLTPDQRLPSAHGSSATPHSQPLQQPPGAPTEGEVQVHRARYVIVTVPVSVLQRRLVRFSPALPAWKDRAIDGMGFGLLNKVVLQFNRPWWDELDQGATNILNVLSTPQAAANGDKPLWIVSMNRAVQAARAFEAAAEKEGRDKAWSDFMQRTRPLVPSVQPQEEYEQANDAAALSAPITAASLTSPSPTPHPAGNSMGSGSPNVLVVFTSGFSSGSREAARAAGGDSFTSCPMETRPDGEVVAAVMAQLRRAFQGGVERKVESAEAEQLEKEKKVHVARVAVDDYPSEHTSVPAAAAAGEALTIPCSYRRSPPCWSVSAPAAARAIPDPTGYVVTRWGLEPYSHGAYTHYRPGSGMHTAAEVGRPVAVARDEQGQLRAVEHGAAASATPSATRLLFAGEGTLGVSVGCADTAWLSGLREAKRVAQLWKQQEAKEKASKL